MSYCDGCHEEVPSGFFCDICSSEPEIRTVWQLAIVWDYICGHEYEEAEEYVYYSVCLNCCRGHAKPTPRTEKCPTTEAS